MDYFFSTLPGAANTAAADTYFVDQSGHRRLTGTGTHGRTSRTWRDAPPAASAARKPLRSRHVATHALGGAVDGSAHFVYAGLGATWWVVPLADHGIYCSHPFP